MPRDFSWSPSREAHRTNSVPESKRAERAAEADVVTRIRRPIVQVRGEDPIVVAIVPIAAAKNGVPENS